MVGKVRCVDKTLDVGCGYLPTGHKRREGIGVDLNKGMCDVVADAQYAPFRDGVFRKIYARNVIEHVENPIALLKEIDRVLSVSGCVSITIPRFHNLCVDEIVKLILGFPFSLFRSLKRLVGWRRNMGERGFWHMNRIQPSHIAKVFFVVTILPIYTRHPVAVGAKGKFLRKLGVPTVFLPLNDVWYIYAKKR